MSRRYRASRTPPLPRAGVGTVDPPRLPDRHEPVLPPFADPVEPPVPDRRLDLDFLPGRSAVGGPQKNGIPGDQHVFLPRGNAEEVRLRHPRHLLAPRLAGVLRLRHIAVDPDDPRRRRVHGDDVEEIAPAHDLSGLIRKPELSRLALPGPAAIRRVVDESVLPHRPTVPLVAKRDGFQDEVLVLELNRPRLSPVLRVKYVGALGDDPPLVLRRERDPHQEVGDRAFLLLPGLAAVRGVEDRPPIPDGPAVLFIRETHGRERVIDSGVLLFPRLSAVRGVENAPPPADRPAVFPAAEADGKQIVGHPLPHESPGRRRERKPEQRERIRSSCASRSTSVNVLPPGTMVSV